MLCRHRQRIECSERFDLSEVVVGDLKPRLLLGQTTERNIKLRLERLRVLLEHHVARLDHRAFGIDPLVEEAVDHRDFRRRAPLALRLLLASTRQQARHHRTITNQRISPILPCLEFRQIRDPILEGPNAGLAHARATIFKPIFHLAR